MKVIREIIEHIPLPSDQHSGQQGIEIYS